MFSSQITDISNVYRKGNVIIVLINIFMQKTYLSMINTQASYHEGDLLIHLFMFLYYFIQNSMIIIYHVMIVIHLYDCHHLETVKTFKLRERFIYLCNHYLHANIWYSFNKLFWIKKNLN